MTGNIESAALVECVTPAIKLYYPFLKGVTRDETFDQPDVAPADQSVYKNTENNFWLKIITDR